MPPRFIFFDLGNVLVHFDHRLACQNLAKVTGAPTEAVHGFLFEEGIQTEFELGRLNNDQFCERIRDRFQCTANNAELLYACSAMFELNSPLVPLVAELDRAGIPLGVLSNTCQAHWDYVTDGRYDAATMYFPRHVLSFEVGVMKPERRIYEVAIEMAGCPPSQIFFMDDRQENVEAALQSGIDAVPFHSVDELRRQLSKRHVEL